MKISYSWLKEYITLDQSPEELSTILTQIGLEVGGIEEVETIKGGLRGLVIGEVMTCESHPDSDHLSKTTVNVGTEELLPIVCGAPNVAAGQKVVVATVGCILYDGDNEFKIKKSKIRGEVSMGMICAEDEIGLGGSHAGIMVLPAEAVPGTPASEYFNIESDYVIEIDLTPNRIDGGGHIGVARDVAAYLKQTAPIEYTKPSIEAFKVDNTNRPVAVEVANAEACPRYAGVTIEGITISESPEWLQNRLRLIGLSPINNVVDITNYVLHETCQPLHAFDLAKVKGDKIVVQTLPAETKFVTLDETERSLHENDLMICNESEPMCIAGVFGGLESGVSDSTTDIFLESAYFNPVSVRKTARRNALNTDSSFRFERGIDPNGTIYALKRAALLIQEIAGGKISSEIVDIISDESIRKPFEVELSYANVTRLIGEDLGTERIKSIVEALEMDIMNESEEGLLLLVPAYRVDVRREADVIEDILRIYGFNNIQPGKAVKSTIQYSEKPEKLRIQNMLSEQLTANGFNEIWSNSLTKANYYDELVSYKAENTVKLFNPLSQDLNGMRQTLLFGGLEAIERNSNFRNPDLKLYEFGNTYRYDANPEVDNPVKNYSEEEHFALWVTGKKATESWAQTTEESSFYVLKSHVDNIFARFGFDVKIATIESDLYSDGIAYKVHNKVVAELGFVSPSLLKKTNISTDVYYADINWTLLIQMIKRQKTRFTPLSKFPEVRRDLALLVDKAVTFDQLRVVAEKSERKLLRKVDIFDVYEGDKLPEGKKSYALSFILRDEEKTLKDKQIEKIMSKMIASFEREVGAVIR